MVKQGYKQTEIGVIPEDWDVKNLIDLSDGGMQNGVFYEVSRKGSGVFFLNVGNLYETAPITTRALEKFDATTNEIERFKVKHGDLFFTRSSIVPSGIAYCNWYKGEKDETTVFDSHVVRFKTDTKQVVPMYLYLQCISHSSRKYFTSNAKVATMTTIDQNQIGRCQIPVPTYDEQERIAEALSDVDNMISSLEKLIAKKKAIKQGAMQELLTGKKRLPGYAGEWVEKKIEDFVVRFATGLNPRQNFKLNNGGTNYYVTIKDFREGKLFLDDACDRIDNAALERINERSDLKKNDLLFSSIGRIGDAYLITETPKNWNINESVFALRPNQQIVSPLMLYYLLTSEDVKNKLLDSTTGSTLKSIKLGHLKEITCRFPKVIEEQIAIASILSDMDNEIETLEQKLAKTRQIKQGMMQQLLTGKIRLVSTNADNKPIEAVSKPHHNHQFDDAVVIAAIVNEFYTDGIPLGRKKVQKLLYLLRRKQEADTSSFKKKAAGPYADEVRYKGGEPIAVRNKYVAKKQGAKGTTFSKGEKIESALEYIEKWEMTDDINWLVSTFKYTKTNDLELFATIDMAICDLINEDEAISVASIKNLIASNKEWKDKLSKTYFSDNDIARAIRFCQSTFN